MTHTQKENKNDIARGLLVSVLTFKLLGSCQSHSDNEKNVNKLGINDFSQTHQRTEITEQAPTLTKANKPYSQNRKTNLQIFKKRKGQ